MKKMAIVGAGIGGLTLAVALQRRGYEVTVYENANEFKPLGAGLALAANAIKAFTELGISSDVLQAGRVIKRFIIKDKAGFPITETDSQHLSERYGLVGNFTIHRADLHRVLQQHLLPGTIQYAKRCISFSQTSSGVSIAFQDGSTAQADCLVAYDGIHSVIRKSLVPDSLPRYAGYTCWRAVINTFPENINLDETSETWSEGKRFGIVPLSDNRLYWFATRNAGQNDSLMQSYTVDDLLHEFEGFHFPIPQILRLTSDDHLIWNDIMDIKPLRQFAFNRVVLAGDAAHATTPNLGQGACMAIEDALILANCLEKASDVVQAFKTFEARRIRRTTQIINDSRRMGRLAQLKNPILAKLRNAAFRRVPASMVEKQMEFLYNVSFH